MMKMSERLAPNFMSHEFACKHCGKLPEKGMSTYLIVLLQLFRNAVGKPLIITSGYRCPVHNRNLGGASNSQHLKGTAVDILIPEGMTVDKMAEIADKIGFNGIGKYYKDNFLHVDVRGTRARWEG